MRVGVMLPLDGPADRPRRWAELRAMALDAEAAGFDSVWVFDHLLMRDTGGATTGFFEGSTALAALAEATERVTLGTLVMAMGFRNPVLLAKMAAAVDDVSNGRLILGIGAGWHRGEFEAFGYPFDHRVGRFEEGLRLLRDLLRTGRSSVSGPWWSARDPELSPPASRPGGPPILIAAARPRMLRLTAELADSWNVAWYGARDGFLADRQRLLAACDEVGRDPATLEQTVGVGIRYPGRSGEPPNPAEELSGPPEAIAEGLAVYADLGVGHAICVQPPDRRGMAFLADALAAYRAGAA